MSMEQWDTNAHPSPYLTNFALSHPHAGNPDNTETMQQCRVVVNAKHDIDDFNTRKRASEGYSRNNLLAVFPGTQPDDALLGSDLGDICVEWNPQLKNRRQAADDIDPPCFSSCNGLLVNKNLMRTCLNFLGRDEAANILDPKQARSAKYVELFRLAVRSQMHFVGLVDTRRDRDGMGKLLGRVDFPAQFGGTRMIRNTGKEVIYAFQPMIWDLPMAGEYGYKQGDKDSMPQGHAQFEGIPKEKLLFALRPYNAKNVPHFDNVITVMGVENRDRDPTWQQGNVVPTRALQLAQMTDLASLATFAQTLGYLLLHVYALGASNRAGGYRNAMNGLLVGTDAAKTEVLRILQDALCPSSDRLDVLVGFAPGDLDLRDNARVVGRATFQQLELAMQEHRGRIIGHALSTMFPGWEGSAALGSHYAC